MIIMCHENLTEDLGGGVIQTADCVKHPVVRISQCGGVHAAGELHTDALFMSSQLHGHSTHSSDYPI